ncbi:MAG: hypothetical protein ABR511_01865 [Acidimicrobiales bacterium]
MTDPEAARAELERSPDMEPVHGTVDVAIPIDVLWGLFSRANLWPRWNRCFYWAWNRSLVRGRKLVWCFQPIRPQYLYKMPAVADIVVAAAPNEATWHVTALPGFFARHTYSLEAVDDHATRFGSWEKAMGWEFRATKTFWMAHFQFVCRESLEGARRLEAIYQRTGRLDEEALPPAR